MNDLPARLLAAIETKEAKARAAGGDEWQQVDPERRPGRIEDAGGAIVTYDEGQPDEGQAEHITENDPKAVLAMCSAHREIVEEAREAIGMVDDEGAVITDGPTHIDPDAYDQIEVEAGVWLTVLRRLARGYGLQEDE